MYRVVSFIVIFLFVSVMLYFHEKNRHHSPTSHNHQQIEIQHSEPASSQPDTVDGEKEEHKH